MPLQAGFASMMLPLLLLLACWCSMVAASGWLGPSAIDCERLGPSNNPHGKTRWGLAYAMPFGGRQEDDRNRIHRLRLGSSATPQGCRGTSNPTSRRDTAPSMRAGGNKSTGRLAAHRLSMLNNGGRGMEAFCDQCGESFFPGASSSSFPSPATPPFSSLGLNPSLAVCGAPDCGVSFSQCVGCEEEYAGCCSAACQALAAEQEPAPRAARSKIFAEMGMRVGQRLNGNGVQRQAGLGAAGSPSFSQARFFQRKGASAVSASARASSSQQEQEGRSRNGETPSSLSTSPGGASSTKGAEARGGEKEKRKRVEGGDESLLESYASRHSEAESSCLAAVREDTNRSQPGGAHMVSGHLQGQLLKLLVTLSGAKRVLDIGTFTGYSALAFAEALPEDGVVVTLEFDARAAETAKGHFASSEHGGKVQLVLGKAMDGIDEMIAEDVPQFDIIFIDADKKRYWDYYDKVLSGQRPLLGPKGMLLADNVLFHELVPMAEVMAAAAGAPPAQGAVNTAQDSGKAAGDRKDVDDIVDKLQPSVFGTDLTGSGLQESLPRREEEKRQQVGVVGGGLLPATPRRMKIAESLDGFNKRVKEDGRVEVLMLPLRDGLSVVTWRRGGYPGGDEPCQ